MDNYSFSVAVYHITTNGAIFYAVVHTQLSPLLKVSSISKQDVDSILFSSGESTGNESATKLRLSSEFISFGCRFLMALAS